MTSCTSASAVPRPLCAARSLSFFSVSGVKCTSIAFRVRKNFASGKLQVGPFTKTGGLRSFISPAFHGGFGDGLHSCQVVIAFDSIFLPLVTGVVGGDDVVLSSR